MPSPGEVPEKAVEAAYQRDVGLESREAAHAAIAAALSAIYEDLNERGYLRHKPDCVISKSWFPGLESPSACTCGLTDFYAAALQKGGEDRG